MSFDRQDQKFPAVLKSLDDKLMETGVASVSLENSSIDFKSEFVPICKMGTQLKVVRVKNDIEVQSFIGEVYLSAQHLLRIVRVEDKILYGALSAFLYETALTGTVRAIIAEEPVGRFKFFRKKFGAKIERSFPVKIHAISMSQVKLTLERPLTEGQQITLSIDDPIGAQGIPLEVEQSVMFGDGLSSYRCHILGLSEENRKQLEWHVAELGIRALKLFPPAPDAEQLIEDSEETL